MRNVQKCWSGSKKKKKKDLVDVIHHHVCKQELILKDVKCKSLENVMRWLKKKNSSSKNNNFLNANWVKAFKNKHDIFILYYFISKEIL